jgi:hypothetical protein
MEMVDEKEFMELKEAVRKVIFSPTASPETIERSGEIRALNNARMCDLRGIIEVVELKDMVRDISEQPIPDKSEWEDLYRKLHEFLEELKEECRCQKAQ